MMPFRKVLQPIALLCIVVFILPLLKDAKAQTSSSAQNSFCGQYTNVKQGIDTIPALVIHGTGEVWFIEPLGLAEIEQTLGPWPPLGSYVTVTDPEIIDGWLFSVSQFAAVPNCEKNFVQPGATPFAKFWADRYELSKGECTQVHWMTENVREVYFNDQGVIGNESREICPDATAEYVLLAIISDKELIKTGFKIEVIVPTPTAPTLGDAASLDSQSEYQTVTPGQTVHLRIVVRNTGGSTWTTADYNFRGIGGWEGRANNLWRDVPPGETITFEEDVIAPANPGDYDYGFVLRHLEQEFGPHFFVRLFVRGQSTPTVQPTSQPATPVPPADSGKPIIFIGKNVNLRSEPNITTGILTTTKSDMSAVIEGQDRLKQWWLACCYTSSPTSRFWVAGSWILGSTVKVEGSTANVPTIQPAKQLKVRLKQLLPLLSPEQYAFLKINVQGFNQYNLPLEWSDYSCDLNENDLGRSECQKEVTIDSNLRWQGTVTIRYTYRTYELGMALLEPDKTNVCEAQVSNLLGNTVTITVNNNGNSKC